MLFNDGFFGNIISDSFPRFNLIKDDDKYYVELALAGFKKEDIKVYVEHGNLIVQGELNSSDNINYLHKGISSKAFKKTFALANNVEVANVVMRDGVLTIQLNKITNVNQLKLIPIQ